MSMYRGTRLNKNGAKEFIFKVLFIVCLIAMTGEADTIQHQLELEAVAVPLAFIFYQLMRGLMTQRIQEKPNYTHLVVILDRSGSMEPIAADTIGGFNKFLEDQKIVPGKATISLIQFDDQYEEVYLAQDIQNTPRLTNKTFIPRGRTALLDAIGRAVEATEKWMAAGPEAPDKVLFAIMTDGEENCSTTYDKTKIFKKIEDKTKLSGWGFVFLGANQDAIKEAGNLGIAVNNTLNYSFSAKGTEKALHSFSANVGALRTSSLSVSAYVGKNGFFNDSDQEEQTRC